MLPSIRELDRDLKISVITTTRAYTDLEQEGFITIIQGKSCYVLSKNSELVREQLIRKIEDSFSSASFLYFCLFIAVLFPIYFKYPFSKVYILANLLIYLITPIGLYVFKKTDLLKNLNQIIQYFTSNQYMIWITGIGVGLILLVISCSLSYLIYKKR